MKIYYLEFKDHQTTSSMLYSVNDLYEVQSQTYTIEKRMTSMTKVLEPLSYEKQLKVLAEMNQREQALSSDIATAWKKGFHYQKFESEPMRAS